MSEPKPPGEVHSFLGIVDADAFPHVDLPRWGLTGAEEEFPTAGEVQAVVGAGDGQGLAHLARAVEKVFPLIGCKLIISPAEAVVSHEIGAGYRLHPAQQHGGGGVLRLGDKVEAVVHTVDEIDVGRPRLGV